MKVLILTQYYIPENPPGAHRLSSLAVSLQNAGHKVEVITAFPNYPNLKIFDGYKVKWHELEMIDNVPVHRSYIYLNPNKTMKDRFLSFVSFQLSSLLVGVFKSKRPDIIICLSPPIFTCFTGVFLKYFYRSKLVLNIADLWPESGVKLGVLKNKFIIKSATWFEEYFYNRADGIACQTMGILNNIAVRTKTKKLFWFRNGVDFGFYEKNKPLSNIKQSIGELEADLIIGYAGLVGYAQGIDLLVRTALLLKGKINVKFVIIGDGPKLNHLKNKVSDNELDNFIFVGNKPKSEMPSYLSMVDVTVVPLIKTDLYLGALPSKIFDSFAVKKPVLLGIDGEARDLFVEKYQCSYYFEPENENQLADLIMQISKNKEDLIDKGLKGYEVMKSDFNRAIINNDVIGFLDEILSK